VHVLSGMSDPTTTEQTTTERLTVERNGQTRRSSPPANPDHQRSGAGLSVLTPASAGWRAFAAEHATSPLQHPAWLDALTSAYRLRARIVALTDPQGAILAGLPMIHGKLPWRKGWTSLPFTDTFEPVVADGGQRDRLLSAVAEYTDTEPILIHTRATPPGWFSRELGTMQVLDISDGAEGVLRDASAGTRREVTRARRAEVELTARPITSRSDFLGESLTLIARSRQRLGAPTQPRRYWSRIWDLHERNEALTIGVYLGETLVANGVFILGSRHAVYKYSASDLATRQLRTNYLMLATAFDHLAARGIRTMDFGISDLHNTGLRKFKARWGGEERPVHFSATDSRMLPDTLEPGPLLTKTIQRTPLFLGRTIGSIAYPFVA
jgi:hypothetical protein